MDEILKLDSNNVLFIGLGQAGNRLAGAVVDKNFRINSLLINTTMRDMASISTEDIPTRYVVPDADGSGGNRNYAKSLNRRQLAPIFDNIKKFPMQKILYFAFSMGGGSGSGMIIPILDTIRRSQMVQKAGYVINLVAIEPFASETKEMHQNALECWNEITSYGDIVSNIYLIDNNKRDTKEEINSEFADLFNQFVTCPDNTTTGDVMDSADLAKITQAYGLSAIYNFDSESEDIEEEIANVMEDSIFVMGTKSIERIGISAPTDFDFDNTFSKFDYTEDKIHGMSDIKEPLLILAGAEPTPTTVKRITDELTKKINELKVKAKEKLKLSPEYSPTVEIPKDVVTRKPRVAPKKEQMVKTPKKMSRQETINTLLGDDDFWDNF